jgi:hypothetical protein
VGRPEAFHDPRSGALGDDVFSSTRRSFLCKMSSLAKAFPNLVSSANDALTRGNIGPILATVKIENTQQYRVVLWLRDLDSKE